MTKFNSKARICHLRLANLLSIVFKTEILLLGKTAVLYLFQHLVNVVKSSQFIWNGNQKIWIGSARPSESYLFQLWNGEFNPKIGVFILFLIFNHPTACISIMEWPMRRESFDFELWNKVWCTKTPSTKDQLKQDYLNTFLFIIRMKEILKGRILGRKSIMVLTEQKWTKYKEN